MLGAARASTARACSASQRAWLSGDLHSASKGALILLDAAICLTACGCIRRDSQAMGTVNVYITFNGIADVAWDDLGTKATLWLCSDSERVPITMTAQKLEELYHVLNHALGVTRPKGRG
jgi:hypothetical protein